jgi:hypothetical protein
MKITELVEKLLKLRDEYGDLDVETRNPAGDRDTVRDVIVEIQKILSYARSQLREYAFISTDEGDGNEDRDESTKPT